MRACVSGLLRFEERKWDRCSPCLALVSLFFVCLSHLHISPPAEAESDDDEEEDEEPILKFEHEPLEANEAVLMPDGSEGVVEGIRRGNVVVRTLGESGVMETFKLEEVKRKHVAPPGYVRPQSEWVRSEVHGCRWLGCRGGPWNEWVGSEVHACAVAACVCVVLAVVIYLILALTHRSSTYGNHRGQGAGGGGRGTAGRHEGFVQVLGGAGGAARQGPSL